MTTDEFKLRQQAEQKGFLTATKIIPAHYTGSTCQPRLVIPKESSIYYTIEGDLVYSDNGSYFFISETHTHRFRGTIYSSNNKQWAQILIENEKELTPFNLVRGKSYFIEGNNIKWYVSNNSEAGSKEKAGFCINVNSGYNSERCYIERYAQFYNDSKSPHAYDNLKDVKIRELTDNEGRWFSHCKDLNKFVPYDSVVGTSMVTPLTEFPKSGMCWKPTIELLNYLKSRESSKGSGHNINIQYITIHQHGLVWNEHNIWTVSTSSSYKEYSIEELMRHIPFSIPDNLSGYPLTPEECIFPEKWAIYIHQSNIISLTAFLTKHKTEWKEYRDGWSLRIGSIFHYPPISPYAHSTTPLEKGYNLITTDQFIKHVLTHTNEKQQISELFKTKKDDKESTTTIPSSCKIQRSNFTIRNTAPIRGVGLKCPKIKVKIGSGYLPD